MSCDDIRRRFLDRDWDQAALEEAAAIAGHLGQCPECRKALQQYEQLRRLLRVAEPAPALEPAAVERLSPRPPGKPQPRPLARWTWLAAMAASLVAAVAGWTMYLRMPGRAAMVAQAQPAAGGTLPVVAAPATVPLPAIQFTRADIDRDVRLFSNVSETFGERTSWVATAGQSAELGLMPAPAVPQHKVLLVRLVMSQGGEIRSSTDLVIVPGQGASLDVPFQSGQTLHYTISTTADPRHRLSLWAEVRTPEGGGETLAALATSLKPVPGEVLSAGRLVTSAGGWNLEVSFHETDFPGGRP